MERRRTAGGAIGAGDSVVTRERGRARVSGAGGAGIDREGGGASNIAEAGTRGIEALGRVGLAASGGYRRTRGAQD